MNRLQPRPAQVLDIPGLRTLDPAEGTLLSGGTSGVPEPCCFCWLWDQIKGPIGPDGTVS